MSEPETIEKVSAFLILEHGQPHETLVATTDLLENWLLDSLAITNLLLYLEAEFGIDVSRPDMTPENLGTLEKIAAFVSRKRDG